MNIIISLHADFTKRGWFWSQKNAIMSIYYVNTLMKRIYHLNFWAMIIITVFSRYCKWHHKNPVSIDTEISTANEITLTIFQFNIVRPQMWPSAVRLNLNLFLCSDDTPCDYDEHRFLSSLYFRCFCTQFWCRTFKRAHLQ